MYQIYDMKCDGMKAPSGIINEHPVFSWRLRSDRNGDRQAAYQILVTDQQGKIVWDSGICPEGMVSSAVYQGPQLETHTPYCWQVKSISALQGETLSEPQLFTIGNAENSWSASWIEADQVRKPLQDCTEMWEIFAGIVTSSEHPEESLNPAVCMRREIEIGKAVKKAYAYGTARGIYSLSVDGHCVSEPLAPGFTVYSQYLEIQQYDVTGYLSEGRHALAIELADGWYTGKIGLPGVGNQFGETNACFLQLEVFYEDGSNETIGTDGQFRWHESAYEYADLIVGSRYRQGFLDEAWKLPDYDDSAWKPVLVKDYPKNIFHGREAEPVRVIRTKKPKDIIITPKGELVVDAGENIVGVLSVRFQAERSTVLKMTHSEVLDKEGNFLMNILGQNKNQMDVFAADREGEVCWQPEYTFHGFRYVKIEGVKREQLLDIDICVIATDLEQTGSFVCSDDRLNRLQENIFRSQQGNMLSIPTDCPQRERAGWTGDMQVYTPTACFNMDMLSFLRKWLANMRLEQLADGQIPNVIPAMPSDKLVRNSDSEHICSAAWGDACVIIPYMLYRKYGDRTILEDNFGMILKWMQYVEKQAATSFVKPEEEYTNQELQYQKYLWNTEFHFGDWLYPSASLNGMQDPIQTAITTKEYVAPAMFAYTSSLMSEICAVLEDEENAAYYKDLNRHIREAYAAVYIDDEGKLPLEIQGLYVLALAMDLYPEGKKEKGLKRLEELIHANGDCLDTGFSSIGFLLDTLWDNGYHELAWKLVFQEKSPSWLYEVLQGATTIWESWNAILPDGTRTNASYNHFAFGCVGDFLYRKILGLRETEPGYRRVEIRPDLTCGLSYAKGSYECPYGEIRIAWEKTEEDPQIEISLPPGVTGELVLESGRIPLDSGTYVRS